MNHSNNVQYAFLDSGIGGIPYFKYLKELHPDAACAYIADIKNFPYGEKTLDEVIALSKATVKKIIDKINPAAIIIACNTISVSALSILRNEFNIPFIGTVPAIKPAAAISKNKKIAVLATERTVNDIYTQKLIEEFGTGCNFFMRADSILVKKIEDNLPYAAYSEKQKAITPAIEFFKATGVDTAVLGCTHFLHLRKEFIQTCLPDIQIVDSLEGVIKQTLKISPVNFKYTQNVKNKFYLTTNINYNNKYSKYAEIFDMELEYLN